MKRVMLVAATALGSLFLVLFLGGMTSAALEIRREKKAGLPVTRPGWERKPRHARGPRSAYLRGLWLTYVVREKAPPLRPSPDGTCPVCGGRLFWNESPEGPYVSCMADFNGDLRAETLHNDHGHNTWEDRHEWKAA